MAGRKEFSILLLFATILYLQTASAQILTPTYFNVASGKDITATATCGEGIPEPERGERYCKLTGNTGDVFRPAETDIIQGQYCDWCNIYDRDKAHPIEYAIDGTEKWWQSPPISRGLEYNEVNITIDLGQLYHVAYIIIKSANSPRPGQWILERSVDYGQTYQAWQYFAETASDCNNVFGMASLNEISKDDDVICTDEYSDIVPLEDGEIVVSLVNGRPGAQNFSYSETLQDWTKATNVRLRLLRTNTLLGHLMAIAREDPTVVRRYYYSVKDISIGGRCFCNGHASTCDTRDVRGRVQCTCEHNTCGPACDECCPGFVQKKWRPATLESSNECEPCNCFGHSTECYYDAQVAAERRSIDIYGRYDGGGVCQNCRDNTDGINCNECGDGYYRPEGRQLDSPYVCERCQCDPFFSTGNCADITGICECRPEYAGPGCSQCNEGYYGYPSCKACDCNINGTLEKICQVSGGQCPCKPSYAGRNCDRCALGYFNFPACEPCACDSIGSRDRICEASDGQCTCNDVYSGRTCNECKDGYYAYPTCRDCQCNPIGTAEEICDKDFGSCLCRDNFRAPRCDDCANGYFNYPVCDTCNCGPGSTSDFCYDNGQCVCGNNFDGLKCDRCAPGYYRYPDCVPCECNFGGSFSISCDQSVGQCDCRSNFQGRMCEQCLEGFYNYPACEECNCVPAGVIDVPGQPLGGCGSATAGACLCKDNVGGRTCNTCEPTYWNLQISNPAGCELCDCNADGTVAGNSICNVATGQCHCKGLVTSRKCEECADGTYQLEGANAFGCKDCGCDVGGAIHGVCNKQTGQCICRPRVTGSTCDEPMAIHFYPSLFQYMFEIESGNTPNGGPLRIGYDDFEFPDFSYLGYAVMSNIQPVVDVPITVQQSDIYRIVLRYMYNGDSTVQGRITLIPPGADPNDPNGVQQSSNILFYPGVNPQLVTVEGGRVIIPFVLDPGRWTVRIEAPEGVLLDYMALLPSAYYEAPVLQVRVNEPCVAGVSQDMCNQYVFPDISIFPTVRGIDGYFDNNGESEPIQRYNEPTLIEDLGIDDLALLDFQQSSLYFIIPIKDLAQYIFIVEYYGGGPGKQQATFDLWGLFDVTRGSINLYDCSYLCRSVVVDATSQPLVFDVDSTDPTGQISPIGNPFPLGISQIIAIPVDQYTDDLITPALKCVKMANGQCAPSSYPIVPGNVRIETGDDGPRPPGQGEPERRLPPNIQDKLTSLMYLSIKEGFPTLTIENVQPLDGSWVFVVHYYQPSATAVDVNFDIPGEFDGVGTFTGHYCPHVSGCRAVVTRPDGSPTFDLNGLGQGITFQLPPNTDGEIWIDYILAIPESSYTPTILIEEPQDRAGDFITQCGQQSFYLNPDEVTEFCQKSVYSLSVEYNNGAQPCECDLSGSTELQCNSFGGQCSCRANIIGRQCTRCKIGFYDFPRCSQCTCRSGVCNEVTGECICPQNVVGSTCDRCALNTYGYNPLVGCVGCECDPRGVDRGDLSCDLTTGQCRCSNNIAGRQCDQCIPGYQGFPFCQQCDCDTSGTTDAICDQSSGQCMCKENVVGDRCDQCGSGTFFLNPSNEKGCISCFCFGVTNDCKKYNRRRGKVDMTSNFGVTNVQDPYLQEGTNIINLYVQGTGVDPNAAIYWTLPKKYVGNKLAAYGGKFEYTVVNNPLDGEQGTPIRRPDIMMSGNNITIMYTHDTQPQAGQPLTVSVDLLESNFQYSFSAARVMRDDFMMVLANIDDLMVRAQYLDEVKDASIADVSMEVAKRDGTGSRAYDVERCTCPPQYTGLSCERCNEGSYRGGPGPYLGTCIPCNCNGHADRCDPITGQCIDCRDGTKGLHCENCDIGYFGDATRGNPTDCQLCACPYPENGRNFASTCTISPVGELKCFCLVGHVGDRCDRCEEGFYGDPSQAGGYCSKCECNFNSDPSAPGPECDPTFGGCLKCAPGTTGDSCENCAEWWWGDAIYNKNCQPCNCDTCGSEYCEKNDGSCECKDGVIGTKCDRCAPTYWGYDSCEGCDACDCSFASYSPQCDPFSGQCACKPGVDGQKCDMCAFGYWNWTPNGCERCECESHLRCDIATGACICPPGATGPQCDQCADRYILTPDGCQPCDECVHELLDSMDDLRDQIDGATLNITEISVGYLAFVRLNRLNQSISDLQDPLQNMIDNNEALGTNITIVSGSLEDLTLLANEVEVKSADVLVMAGDTSVEAEATKVRAEDLEAKINATLQGIRDAINALVNGTPLGGNITSDEIARLIEEARRIVAEIGARDFNDNEELTDTELALAKDVLDRAMGLRNASHSILERALNVSQNVNDFLDMLNDLLNQSAMANNMTDEANAILDRNSPPKFQVALDQIQGNFSAAQEENTNATQLLEQAQKFLDAANKALGGSQLNASMLEAAMSKLEPRIPILKGQAADLTPLVDMAKKYAQNLTRQAEYLDGLLRDTRDLAENALKAANAYENIVDAINAAEAAAKAALNASQEAERGAGSFGTRPEDSKKRSTRLGKKAVKALNGVQELEGTLGGVRDSVDKIREDLDGADRTLQGIRDGINDIPEDSSKCTVVSCGEGAPDDCKPGFTGEECSAALLGQEAQDAVDVAMEADGSAQNAQDIADWVMARLGDLEDKGRQLNEDVGEANKAFDVADNAIDEARGHIDTFRNLDMSLTEKHKRLDNMTRFMNYNLADLKKKINEARTIAAGVKVAMKFVTDSSLHLRRPAGYQEASTRNVIELYFNTRMDNALLYFAGGPLPDDPFMAIEIVGGKPTLRYNLGGVDGVAVVEDDVSDGQWHKIVADRNAGIGRIVVYSEGVTPTIGGDSLDTGAALTFDPEAEFFIGGVPPTIELPGSINAFSFEGCIDSFVYNEESVGLWNFLEGNNVNQGCLRNVSTLGTPPEEGWYYDGSGYVQMVHHGEEEQLNIRSFDFKTLSPNGLLYFAPAPNGDYIALELRNGKLLYQWDLGSGKGELESDEVYNNGEWTNVQIIRDDANGKMVTIKDGSADNLEDLRGVATADTSGLDNGEYEFYGGVIGVDLSGFSGVTSQGFRGCIRNPKVGGDQRSFSNYFGTDGTSPTCVPTSITSVSFGGAAGGWMSWTPVNIDRSKAIVFQFRTDQPEGLIMYTANEESNNYLAAAIVGGELHVVADSGGDRVELRSNNNNYNDGELHTVVINKKVKNLRLTVDDTDTNEVEFNKKSLTSDFVLFLGGLPQDSNVQAGVLPTTNPFQGCIINLAFDGELLSMIASLRDELNAITNTCDLGGPGGVGPGGAVNTTGPVPIVVTTPVPATEPPTCTLPLDPSEAERDPEDEGAFQFGISPTSHFAYPTLDTTFRKSGLMALDVRTNAINGFLFHVADSRQIDKQFAFIKDGKVFFGFDYGSGPLVLESNIKINDGEWHQLEFDRVRSTGIIRVDGVEVAKDEIAGTSSYLTTSDPLYLGGAPSDYMRKGIPAASEGSLLGCIKNLVLNGVPAGEPNESVDVEPCSGIKEPGVFFGPSGGHVQIAETYNVGARTEVRLSIKPRSNAGIIFSVSDTPKGDYLSLEMVNGTFFLRTDNGVGEIMAMYTPPEGDFFICDGNWHDIVAIKDEHILQLIVDEDEGPITEGNERAKAANTNHALYLGGLPDGVEHRGLTTDDTFVGCIRDVMFGEDLTDFKTKTKVGDVDLLACPTR